MSHSNSFKPAVQYVDSPNIFSFAIDEEPLRFRGDVFHAYHFRCTGCDEELTSTAREVKVRQSNLYLLCKRRQVFRHYSVSIPIYYCVALQDELFCLRCHDKMGIPICGACRRPIEERVVTALGKNWDGRIRL